MKPKAEKQQNYARVRIEQDQLPSCEKQQSCLTIFAMDLADMIIPRDTRDPLPKPRLETKAGRKYYVLEMYGKTKLNSAEIKDYLAGRNFSQPYTKFTVAMR